MHLAHFFDFVEVDHETALVGVVLLDALATEDGQVIGAVKVLHALVVPLAHQAIHAFLVLEVDVPQYRVPLNQFIKDVEVQGKLVHCLDLLDQFATNWTTYPVVVVED